jgi:hypothetical protein
MHLVVMAKLLAARMLWFKGGGGAAAARGWLKAMIMQFPRAL